LTLDASGKFLYVGNTVSNDISAYIVDKKTGSLMPVPGSPFPAGNVPFGLAVGPSDRFLYVSNLASKDIFVFAIDDETGSLQKIQTMTSGGSAVSIVIKEVKAPEE
jgi:6-phosphogluconolactonase (cycloisomerase 2 family)